MESVSRRASGRIENMSVTSNDLSYSASSRRDSQKFGSVDTLNLVSLMEDLQRRGMNGVGSVALGLADASHDRVLEWISAERMNNLPPEGSSHDKVLAWAKLFVERLHSFHSEIAVFANDSIMGAQVSYGYCQVLLEVC